LQSVKFKQSFWGIKAFAFARQLVSQKPVKHIWQERWQLDEACEAGFATRKGWDGGLPHNLRLLLLPG
jgi:hypothetical protein